MSPRLFVVAALVVGWNVSAEPSSQPRATPVSVHAVVERAQPVVGPLGVVPWKLVRDLAREDFEIVTDSGSPPIESFSTDDAPITIVVLVDVSASAEIDIDWLLEPLQKFLIPALKPGDRVAFGRFGGMGLRLDARFMGDRRELLSTARDELARRGRQSSPPPATALDSANRAFAPVKPDPVIQVEGRNGAFGLGASPAWDAVDAGVTALESQTGRRAIILVTDGRSTGNVHGLDETILHAVAADVSVSIVGEAQEELIRQSETKVARVRPAVFLQSMAEMTGGAYADVFGPEKKRPARSDDAAVKRWLGRVLAHLVDDLHNTYTLSFFPSVLDGRVHGLDVRVKRAGLKVRARHGYLAPFTTPTTVG
jgi:VWFA-related protein